MGKGARLGELRAMTQWIFQEITYKFQNYRSRGDRMATTARLSMVITINVIHKKYKGRWPNVCCCLVQCMNSSHGSWIHLLDLEIIFSAFRANRCGRVSFAWLLDVEIRTDIQEYVYINMWTIFFSPSFSLWIWVHWLFRIFVSIY